MKKISNWLFRKDLELNKKWWHRLVKVLFYISLIILAGYLVVILMESSPRLTNRWNYVESFSQRLSKDDYSGKFFNVSQLYEENEVITEDKMYGDEQYYPKLSSKRYLFPMSGMFLDEYKSKNFCSDELHKQIENIASVNKIKLFSPINPTFNSLFSDITTFSSYLKNNSYSIKCVMINSYSIENEDGKIDKYVFLEPINTFDYRIYKYEDGTLSFIFAIMFAIASLFLYIVISLIIYYKIILYIIFGSKNNS